MAARGWALPLGAAACGLAVWVALRRRKRAVLALPRLSSDAGASALAAALQRCGVVVVEGLAPELAEQAKRELADKGLQGTFHGAEGSFAGHHTRRNAGKALGESLAAQELAQHPLILEAVEKVLLRWCKRINLGTCSAISVEPPSGNEAPAPPQVLHRDNSMWGASTWPWLPSSSFKGRPEFSVSVMRRGLRQGPAVRGGGRCPISPPATAPPGSCLGPTTGRPRAAPTARAWGRCRRRRTR
ncbi:unnamed protein product [Effrenium voratum]|nr:unnamed protein product [Effrenium voratum]